jgi:pyridoxine 5-phosphate synthase
MTTVPNGTTGGTTGRAPLRLNVNVDHVATIREARRIDIPDPVEAAALAEEAGAHGITVHLRGDRRHIQERDLERLATSVRGKLNLEMAASEDMVAIATRVKPGQITLVAERREEITTEGGLDVARLPKELVHRLRQAGLSVALFVDPDEETIDRTIALRSAGGVDAIELNTDAYARATSQDNATGHLGRLQRAAQQAASAGLAVYAGHALHRGNVQAVAAIPQIEELNIGHALIGRAVMVGIAAATRELLDAMASARSHHSGR